MRIQTFSIVAGSEACNARCPFCVSRMTPDYVETDGRAPGRAAGPVVNWRNFDIACRFAKDSGVSTVLITGKGEPTLYPEQITSFLAHLEPYHFPFVELQSNGIAIGEGRVGRATLRSWYDRGLTLVAVSVVDADARRNAEIFRPATTAAPVDLAQLIERLHEVGFAVRLSCTMVRGHVDRVEAAEALIGFARTHGVEQLTLRPVELPGSSRDEEVARWVEAHRPGDELIGSLRALFDGRGVRLMELVHGAVVYDFEGQNVCLSNCLTIDPGDERVRQLIFFPDGHLRYDWQYQGAILI